MNIPKSGLSRRLKSQLQLLTAMAATAVIAASCTDSRPVWVGWTDLDPDAWKASEFIEFAPDSAAMATLQARPVKAVLAVRYARRSCDIRQLPLIVTTETYSSEAVADTLRLSLFDADDKPLGKGSYSIYEVCDTIVYSCLPAGWRLTLSTPSDVRGLTGCSLQLLTE